MNRFVQRYVTTKQWNITCIFLVFTCGFLHHVIAGPTQQPSSSEESDCDKIIKDSICYKVSRQIPFWEEAAAECRLYYNGRIASPRDVTEGIAIVDVINENLQPDESVWLGGSLENDYDWRWLDGGYVVYQGCYLLNSEYSDMEEVASAPSISSSECTELCEGLGNFTYSGTHAEIDGNGGYEIVCSCGNRYDASSVASDADCLNTACHRNYDPATCLGKMAFRILRNKDISGRVARNINGSRMWSQRDQHELYGNCAMLEQPEFTITKTGCTERKAHICQYVMTDYECTQLYGLTWVEDTCISLHTDDLTWHEARAACRTTVPDYPGDLLTISTVALHGYLQQNLMGRGEDWFIGLTNRLWIWDTDYGDIGLTGYTFWAPRSPTYQYATRSTGCIMASHLENYQWVTEDCRTEARAICESGPHITPDNVTVTYPAGSDGFRTPKPTPSPTSSNSTPSTSVTTGYNNVQTSTIAATNAGSGPGTTKDIAIGLGAGIGVLVSVIVIGSIIYSCRRRHKKESADQVPVKNGSVPQPEEGISNGGYTHAITRARDASVYSGTYEEIPADHVPDEGYEPLGPHTPQERGTEYESLNQDTRISLRSEGADSSVYTGLSDTVTQGQTYANTTEEEYIDMSGSCPSDSPAVLHVNGDIPKIDVTDRTGSDTNLPDLDTATEIDSTVSPREDGRQDYLQLVADTPRSGANSPTGNHDSGETIIESTEL